jgi:hypothetical protein
LNVTVPEEGDYQLSVVFDGSDTQNIGMIYVAIDSESSPSSNLTSATQYIGRVLLTSGEHTLTIMAAAQSVNATITLTKVS